MSQKRKILIFSAIILAAILLIFTLMSLVYLSIQSQGAKIIGISSSEAQYIALKLSGYDKKDVGLLCCELNLDGKAGKYHVEFFADGQTHRFDISAADGTLLIYNSDLTD